MPPTARGRAYPNVPPASNVAPDHPRGAHGGCFERPEVDHHPERSEGHEAGQDIPPLCANDGVDGRVEGKMLEYFRQVEESAKISWLRVAAPFAFARLPGYLSLDV
jgi:hypothetical protein